MVENILENHQIEAVIFDMDGLIVDSEPFWQQAEIELFKTVGIHLTLENCHETTGLPTRAVVEYWYNKMPWEGKSIEMFDKELIQKAANLIKENATPMKGFMELFAKIKSLGLKIGLASASPIFLIEIVLEKFGFKNEFDFYHSAMLEKNNKPHPDVYLTVANTLNAKIANCLILEDSGNGVKGAVASGAIVIAVPAEFEFKDAKFEIANYKLRSLEELL